MAMFEAADEHTPDTWVSGLLGVIADQLADSRRGITVDPTGVVQVTRYTDDGDQVVLTLTVSYQPGD